MAEVELTKAQQADRVAGLLEARRAAIAKRDAAANEKKDNVGEIDKQLHDLGVSASDDGFSVKDKDVATALATHHEIPAVAADNAKKAEADKGEKLEDPKAAYERAEKAQTEAAAKRVADAAAAEKVEVATNDGGKATTRGK